MKFILPLNKIGRSQSRRSVARGHVQGAVIESDFLSKEIINARGKCAVPGTRCPEHAGSINNDALDFTAHEIFWQRQIFVERIGRNIFRQQMKRCLQR